MYCRKCGNQIPDDSEFCFKCGAAVTTEGQHKVELKKPEPSDDELVELKAQKCMNCGEKIFNIQKTCHNCGAVNPSYNSEFDNDEIYTTSREIADINDKFDSAESESSKPKQSVNKVNYETTDYEQFKSASYKVAGGVTIAFVIILLLTGVADCTGFDEISMTEENWLMYVFVIAGIYFVRWLIAFIYKHTR